nr:hypothetical protein GCM10011355_32770 [Aquisalinus luteolus]
MDSLAGLVFLCLSLIPVAISAVALVRLFPVAGRRMRWLQALLLVMAQCVLTSLVLGTFDILHDWLLLLFNMVIAAGLVFLVYRRKVPSRAFGIRELPTLMRQWFVQRPVSTSVIAAVILISVVNIVWAVFVGPLFGDAEAYHLARAYFWDRLGSLDHFPTADARQVESPLNGNLLQYWVIAFGDNHALTHLHQAAGLAMIVLCTLELGRQCRMPVLGGLLAAGTVICAPQLVLAATNGSNDLLTGGLGFSSLVFGLRAIARSRGGWRNEALMASIAAGLAVGGKVTAIPLIFGVACALLAFIIVRRMAIKRVAMFAALAAVGAVSLGTYGYVRNIIEFGHPVYSPTAQAEHGEIFRNDRRDPLQNIAVTMLQSPDLHGFAVGPLKPLRDGERVLIEKGLDAVGADDTMKRGVLGYFDRATRNADWNGSGYGIIGFLLMLVSPVLAIILLVLKKYRRRALPAVLAIGAGWAYLLVVSGIVPWNVTGEIRYFQAGFPLIAAGALLGLAMLVSRRLLLALCILSLAPLVYTTWSGGEAARMHGDAKYAKPFKGALYYLYGGKQVENIDLFADNFSGQKVGIWTRKHTYQYYFLRDLKGVDIVPADGSQIASRVASGDLAAGIVSPITELGEDIYMAVPTIFDRRRQFWLVVADPAAFIRDNALLYGLGIAGGNGGSSVSISGENMLTFLAETDRPDGREGGLLSPRWNRRVLVVSAPTGALADPASTETLQLTLNAPAAEEIAVTASCGDGVLPARFDQTRKHIIVEISGNDCVDPRAGITQITLDKASDQRLEIRSFALTS